MPIDASIPLQVQPVQAPDPIMSIGKLMQLRNMGSEYALHQQQIQQSQAQTADLQAQAQQRQRDVADQNTIQELMRDPTTAQAFHVGDFSALAGKVQPKTIQAVQANQAKIEGDLLTNTQAQNTVRGQAYGEIADTTQGLQSLAGKNPDGTADLSRVNAELPNAIARLRATGAFQRAGIDAPDVQAITDPAQLDAFLGGARGAAALHAKVADLQKTQAGTALSTAQAGEATATQAKTQLQTQIEQHQLDLYKTLTSTPEALQQRVAKTIDPQKYPALYQRAVNEAKNAKDLAGINDAIGKYAQQASEEEKTISVESNPKVLTARRESAIAQARALREGDNPALSGVPPAAAGPAMAAATKLDQDYIKAKTTSEALGHILDLAESGNKAAGSNLPLVGVETLNALNGIKRINTTEIDQYQGAGSLLDQIQGKIGKLVSGQPIDQSLLDDIRELHQTLAQQAYQQYTSGLNSLNARSGAKFPDTVGPVSIRKAPAAAGSILIVAGDGTIHPFKSEAEAKDFEQRVAQAGGTTKRQNQQP